MKDGLFVVLSIVNILLTTCNISVLLVVRRYLKHEVDSDDFKNEQGDE